MTNDNEATFQALRDAQREIDQLTAENAKWFENYQSAVEERNVFSQEVERLRAENARLLRELGRDWGCEHRNK